MGPETKSRCSFKIPDDKKYQCPFPVTADGVCIFHVPKNGRDPLVALARLDDFDDQFQQLRASLIANNSDVWDFRGFQFPSVSFEGQSFEAPIRFEHAVFTDTVVFGGAIYRQPVNLSLATFHRSAVFNRARFMSDVRFIATQFGHPGNLNLDGCSAIFRDARFAATAVFTESVFRMKGLFVATHFGGETTFDRPLFFDEVSFQDATLERKVLFRGGLGEFHRQSTECFTRLCHACDFRDLLLTADSDVRFEDVNLEKARFTGTDLERIRFQNVEWHRQPHRFWRGRQSLAEEFLLPPGWGDGVRDRAIQLGDELLFGPVSERERSPARTQKMQSHYAKVAENYSQLVRNYEARRDFAAADEFYVGEMEARRKGALARVRWTWLRWWRRWFGVGNLYRILSRYGTSYQVAAAWLMFWLLAFATAFLAIGIEPTERQSSSGTAVIRYDVLRRSAESPLELRQLGRDYMKAVTIPLAAVLEQPAIYKPVGEAGWALLIAELLLVPLQGYFVVLALKRRFKRG